MPLSNKSALKLTVVEIELFVNDISHNYGTPMSCSAQTILPCTKIIILLPTVKFGMMRTMQDIIVRPEIEADFSAVYKINEHAFIEDTEALLVNVLRQSQHFVPELSLVAEKMGEIIGYVLFTTITIGSHSDHKSLALAPLAVRRDLQKQGIGSQLITEGLARARALGFQSVVVLGYSEYYPKFGFEPAHSYGITAPYNDPAHTFAMELQPHVLSGIKGQVHYAPEFAKAT